MSNKPITRSQRPMYYSILSITIDLEQAFMILGGIIAVGGGIWGVFSYLSSIKGKASKEALQALEVKVDGLLKDLQNQKENTASKAEIMQMSQKLDAYLKSDDARWTKVNQLTEVVTRMEEREKFREQHSKDQ